MKKDIATVIVIRTYFPLLPHTTPATMAIIDIMRLVANTASIFHKYEKMILTRCPTILVIDLAVVIMAASVGENSGGPSKT